MKTIITIQHTQSIHHTNGMVGSWTDWDLSELGVRQAETLAKNLAAELSEGYVLYTSDLRRARQTAAIVAEKLGITEIRERKELRERNLGEAVGKSVAWLQENIVKQEVTIDDRMFPSAESRRDVWERLTPFLQEILDSPEEKIILVSHGDILSVWNALWLGMQPEQMNHCDLWGAAGSVGIMRAMDNGKRVINRMGDMSYLR